MAGVARAQADEEAVGDQHHDLAAGEGREAADHPLEGGEGLAGVVHDLDQHALGHAASLLPRHLLVDVAVVLADFLDGQPNGLGVAAIDELGLVLGEMRNLVELDAPLLKQVESLDGPAHGRALAGQLLRETHGAAGSHEGDLILGGKLLVHELQEGHPGRHEVRRGDVQVVDGDDDLTAAHLDRGRHGRGRGSGHWCCVRSLVPAQAALRAEHREILGLAVFPDLEIGLGEARNRAPLLVGDHRVDLDELHAHRRQDILRGRRTPAIRSQG